MIDKSARTAEVVAAEIKAAIDHVADLLNEGKPLGLSVTFRVDQTNVMGKNNKVLRSEFQAVTIVQKAL